VTPDRIRWAAALLAAALSWTVSAATPSRTPAPPKGPTSDDCLACHGDASAVRANNTSVAVDPEKFAASAHGAAGLGCADCHADLAAATEFPHAETLARVDCAPCHDAQVADYRKSVHASSRTKDQKSLAATCIDCHGTHDIRKSEDPTSRTYARNIVTTCVRCHGDPKVVEKAHIPGGDVGGLYKDSIHGKLQAKGLTVAPTCKTCHGVHDVLAPNDPAAKIFRGNVASTCGTCHKGAQELYESSVHGTQAKAGNVKAPVCIDCHTTHGIRAGDEEKSRLFKLKECGTCHEARLASYGDTYHGQVTSLGFSRIATCADCHRGHDIFPTNDPRSSVNAANRVKTCQRCHPKANENFAKYQPHADPKDPKGNFLLYVMSFFMKWLLVGVFTFFGLHTALWFPRSWKERKAHRAAQGHGPAPEAGPQEKKDE